MSSAPAPAPVVPLNFAKGFAVNQYHVLIALCGRVAIGMGTRHLHVNGRAELSTGVDGVGTELLLDAQDLVELGQTLGTGWSTGFLFKN